LANHLSYGCTAIVEVTNTNMCGTSTLKRDGDSTIGGCNINVVDGNSTGPTAAVRLVARLTMHADEEASLCYDGNADHLDIFERQEIS
jgi:hypothetical protein